MAENERGLKDVLMDEGYAEEEATELAAIFEKLSTEYEAAQED